MFDLETFSLQLFRNFASGLSFLHQAHDGDPDSGILQMGFQSLKDVGSFFWLVDAHLWNDVDKTSTEKPLERCSVFLSIDDVT